MKETLDGNERQLTICDLKSTLEFKSDKSFISRSFDNSSEPCVLDLELIGTWKNNGNNSYSFKNQNVTTVANIKIENSKLSYDLTSNSGTVVNQVYQNIN